MAIESYEGKKEVKIDQLGAYARVKDLKSSRLLNNFVQKRAIDSKIDSLPSNKTETITIVFKCNTFECGCCASSGGTVIHYQLRNLHR